MVIQEIGEIEMDFLKKQPKEKKINLGENLDKGQISKECKQFFTEIRKNVDKTFVAIQHDPEAVSSELERTFETLMKVKEHKEIHTESFMLGLVFCLSRFSFNVSEIQKQQSSKKNVSYVS